MSKLTELLVQLCLLTTSSKCVWGKQIPTQAVHTPEPLAKLVTNVDKNVVEVTDDQWGKISHATSLDDLNGILGITLPVEEPKDAFPLASSSFRDAFTPENLLLRNAVVEERYITNSDLTVCTPETRVVDLDLQPQIGVKYYPKCVKIQRCGGCCNDASRQCKPVDTRKVLVKVLRLTSLDVIHTNAALRRRGNRRVRRRRREKESVQYDSFNATMVEHTKCDCQCRIQESDCSLNIHEYDPMGCSCVCKNKDKRDKCMNDGLRYWSEDLCDCKCRQGDASECSTGKYFNEETCQCEVNKVSSNFDYLIRKAQDQLDAGISRIRPLFQDQ